MPVFPSTIVGFPIENNLPPLEGAQSLPVTVVFDDASSFVIDLRGARDASEFGSIQAAYINNSQNENPVIITVASGGASIVAPPFSQVILPIYAKEPLFNIRSDFVAGVGSGSSALCVTSIQFLNIFQAPLYVPCTFGKMARVNAVLPANNTSVNITSLPTNFIPFIASFDLSIDAETGDFTAGVSTTGILRSNTKQFAARQLKIIGASIVACNSVHWRSPDYGGVIPGEEGAVFQFAVAPALPSHAVRITGTVSLINYVR